MKNTYFETVKLRMIEACMRTNDYAKRKDPNRNRVNYGEATTWAWVLRDMGHDVDVWNYEDDGYLLIPNFIIDGEKSFDLI